MTATLTDIKGASISDIAGIIRRDWNNVYFGAVPYLEAMFSLDSVNDSYGYDDGKGIIRYFLGNATSWRGETARTVKAELKRRIK